VVGFAIEVIVTADLGDRDGDRGDRVRLILVVALG